MGESDHGADLFETRPQICSLSCCDFQQYSHILNFRQRDGPIEMVYKSLDPRGRPCAEVRARVSDEEGNGQPGCSSQFIGKSGHRLPECNSIRRSQVDEVRIVCSHRHGPALFPPFAEPKGRFLRESGASPLALVPGIDLKRLPPYLQDPRKGEVQSSGYRHVCAQKRHVHSFSISFTRPSPLMVHKPCSIKRPSGNKVRIRPHRAPALMYPLG
jgi:hypothetical protein